MRNFIMSGLASAVILGSAFGAQAQGVTVESVAAACSAGPCGPELAALGAVTPGGINAAVRQVVTLVAEIAPARVAATVAVASELPGVTAATQTAIAEVAAAAEGAPTTQTAAGPAGAPAGAADADATNNNSDSNANGNLIPQTVASTN